MKKEKTHLEEEKDDDDDNEEKEEKDKDPFTFIFIPLHVNTRNNFCYKMNRILIEWSFKTIF